jgi:hypothetical protein
MRITNGFEVDGNLYEYKNLEQRANGVALFDPLTGFGGIDFYPFDGATVKVITGVISTDMKNLEPEFNNKVYYLVSDREYTRNDKDLMISLATEIPVTLNVDRYEGTFVFNNPDNFPYLYLLWNYVDSLGVGAANYTGDRSDKVISVDYGVNVGIAGLDYSVDNAVDTRFVLKYNNATVGDTGFINSTSGTLEFNKFSADITTAELYVYSPSDGNDWTVEKISPSLTSFYIYAPNDGVESTVKNQIANTQMWHDGSGAVPTAGNNIYTDANGFERFAGGNAYHLVSPTIMVAPPVSGLTWIIVNDFGQAVSDGAVDYGPIVAPTITQEDIYVVRDESVNVFFQADAQVDTWNIISDMDDYELAGSETGTIFTYTDKYTNTVRVTVNINETITVASSTIPVVILGDGGFTYLGVSISSVLPVGMTFDPATGRLFGSATEGYIYPIEVTATNVIGTSAPVTFNILITPEGSLTPFAIDIENVSEDVITSCALTGVYSLLYHNGNAALPDVNDIIFIDPRGLNPLMGGNVWYNIETGVYVVKVTESGTVSESSNCSI